MDGDAVGIAGYNFFFQNRKYARGGGVGVYIKDTIDCSILFQGTEDYIESMWLKVLVSKHIVIIGIIYRPPNSNFSQFLNYVEDTLSNIYSEYDNIICMGDFNINMIESCSNNSKNLESVFSSFNMSQLIKEPTHVSTYSMSLIDLLFTNLESIINSGVIDVGVADHFLIFSQFKLGGLEDESEENFFL